MSEPTIDDLLAWFDKWVPSPQGEAHKAIRAILEQQKFQDEQMQAWYRGKENEVLLFRGKVEREAIRAFVERVRHRVSHPHADHPPQGGDYWVLQNAIDAELAALEQETK